MRGHPLYSPTLLVPWTLKIGLRTVERESHTTQCNDREKVLYGPRQLRGAAQFWWESYLATHADPEAITWEEFRDNFRRYHMPEGLMIVRKEEFLALKQGPLSVSEYRDKFLQLSRYAPEDVNTDAKRQYRFLRGLDDPLHYQLMNHTFPTFQHLIDRAIMTERKRREMEDRKCKIGGSQAGVVVVPAMQPALATQARSPAPASEPATSVSEAISSAIAAVPLEHPTWRKSVPTSEQSGARISVPATNENGQVAPAQVGGCACFYYGEQNH
jgi:hypothetical protein